MNKIYTLVGVKFKSNAGNYLNVPQVTVFRSYELEDEANEEAAKLKYFENENQFFFVAPNMVDM